MNQNPFKTLGIATLLLLAGLGRPAVAQTDPVARARQIVNQLRVAQARMGQAGQVSDDRVHPSRSGVQESAMKFLSVRDLRSKSGEVWKGLAQERELVVTSNGRPIAILSEEIQAGGIPVAARPLAVRLPDPDDEAFSGDRPGRWSPVSHHREFEALSG